MLMFLALECLTPPSHPQSAARLPPCPVDAAAGFYSLPVLTTARFDRARPRVQRLKAARPSAFGFSVSHTTRAPRPGEEDGVHYHFVDTAAMEASAPSRLTRFTIWRPAFGRIDDPPFDQWVARRLTSWRPTF
jgi:hypothetical protein